MLLAVGDPVASGDPGEIGRITSYNVCYTKLLRRLLVFQDSGGRVWMAYTDFAWIARRHRITNREEQFNMASQVIASIVSSAVTS